MASLTRSSVLAAKQETTEGTLQAITAGGDFIQLREGFSLQTENEVIDTDSLVNGIGGSKSIVVGENPSASIPLYNKHSGTEGTAPEYDVLILSAMGTSTTNATEYDTIVGSTTTNVVVDSDEGSEFEVGQGLLIKDGTNGYSLRNVDSIDGDTLALNFNIGTAPGTSVNLGKAINYKPVGVDHPTYSLYRFQAETGSDFKDAIAGCRTVGMAFEFPARGLATFTPEIEGLKYYFDYITIDSTNDDFSIDDDGGNVTGSIEQKTYQTPLELASEIATKLTAASVGSGNDTISCSYSSSTGKFAISSDGTTLELNCSAANSVFAEIGFGSIDLTGATSYTAATALSFNAPYTPSFDSSDPKVVIDNELFIGDSDDNTCRKATTASFNIGTPKTNVLSICASNGVSETLTLEREVTFTATLILEKYEAELFDRAFNNTTTKLLFNAGSKDNSGNWEAGKCMNIFMKQATITSNVIADNDGYVVLNIEAKGFITSSAKDVYINYL